MCTYCKLWGIDSKHNPECKSKKVQPVDSRFDETYRQHLKKARCPCTDWIDDLALEYDKSSKLQTDKSNSRIVVFWVNALFDKLSEYATVFSERVSAINIDVLRPDFHTVACRESLILNDSNNYGVVYEGHLASPTAALLIKGAGHFIDAYIIPSHMLLALSLNETALADYPPVLELDLKSSDRAQLSLSTPANSDQLTIDASSVALVAQVLFKQFIEYSRSTSRTAAAEDSWERRRRALLFDPKVSTAETASIVDPANWGSG